MTAADSFAYPNFVGDYVPHPLFDGIIENIDGSKMYVVEAITVDLGEEKMILDVSQPLTIKWAIGLSLALLISALGIAGGTYALIHSDVNDVRASLDTVRDGASTDVNNLRSDMRTDFSRMDSKFDKVGDKLDRITEIVTDTRVQQAKSNN
ncbi:hypothetical protein [Leclercia adecarboxylata]|uniref:hypothetical protein n=1 Tax=Leclercia adecarboxylata TaxID=83655 RepID=UPI0022E0691A|nr:hypothetical protein [Leclercia adecarboxylata]